MPIEYKIGNNSGDSHQLSPYWVMLVVRFANRKTVDINKMTERGPEGIRKNFNVSTDDANKEPVKEMGDDKFFIHKDCTAWSMSTGKQSHISSCSMQLIHSDTDYTNEVVPGDWVLVWLENSEEAYNKIIDKINKNQRCNYWGDGFKFMGRVQSVIRSLTRNAAGQISINYQMMAGGFTELDNQIFYHPAYSQHFNNDAAKMGFWLSLDTQLQTLMSEGNDSRQPLHSQQLIPTLLNALLGKDSVTKNAQGSTDTRGIAPLVNSKLGALSAGPKDEEALPSDLTPSPNSAYLVPSTVAKLISPEAKTYDHLLKGYIGLQTYSDNHDKVTAFTPNNLKPTKDWLGAVWRETKTELSGQFLFLPGPFSGQSVWSILYTYCNAPVDEMFTCMRTDPYGYIMPTLVVRQTCFNSEQFTNKYPGLSTSFVSLPRWVIDDSMIYSVRHGTSESQRLNYVHLLGKDISNTTAGQEMTLAMSRNPPVADLADISRSGLKMKMGNINANLNERFYDNASSPGSLWQNIVSDGMMNGHLKHSGQISCAGIVEPICEGDNVVADGMIFHIEKVSHSGSIAPSGHKMWNTSIDVSNGIPVESDNNNQHHFTYYSDSSHLPTDEPTNEQ